MPAGGMPASRGGACLERGCLPGGGACLEGGVPAGGDACLEGGCLPGGGGLPAWRGGACLGRGVPENLEQAPPPPVDRMTHACENITSAKTSFRPVTSKKSMKI